MAWISVKHRLPPFEKAVIVCTPSGYDGAPVYSWGARVDGGEGWLWAVGGRWGVRTDKDASWNNIEADDDYKVTHWMPMPRPPFRTPRQEPK